MRGEAAEVPGADDLRPQEPQKQWFGHDIKGREQLPWSEGQGSAGSHLGFRKNALSTVVEMGGWRGKQTLE